ncbi:MAG: GAF domain-containing protein [Candidatus Krumholzibacteriota bacterium]|nr:GAF domain-containing protein [Candidatus Krumholzibacteriota bacterium]
MKTTKNIAILGGGEDELNILSEFHRNPGYKVIAVYDSDPRAVALEIAEIIGIPKFSDRSFISEFRNADYIIVTDRRKRFAEEIQLLQNENLKIINPSEAANHLVADIPKQNMNQPPWPQHLETALKYIRRITDRGRLLKWLLEISVRAVGATSGSIMLHSEHASELYIGYASGLSSNVIKNTRQKIGEGIAGEVAASRISKLISDIRENTLYSRERERPDIISAISTPLLFNEHLIGVLNISTSKGEKFLTENDLSTVELLASKISPILDQHLRIDTENIKDIEYQTRNTLESLFRSELGFHEKFTVLSASLAEKLEADTVTIYTATDEGDWLILGGSAQHDTVDEKAPRIHCSKGTLAKSFLNGEEIIMTEAVHETSLKIKSQSGSITSIYIPLSHHMPLGVLVMEFSQLHAMERFLKLKDTLSFQVGFFVYSQLKELKQQRKLKRYEELSSMTPFIMGIEKVEERLKHIPEIMSSLVSASRGSFYFSMHGRETVTYSGLPEEKVARERFKDYDDEIRKLSLNTEKPDTISYLSKEVDTYERVPLYRSVITYPFRISEGIHACYNGYEKNAQSPLDSSIFGQHELKILDRIRDILIPILKKNSRSDRRETPSDFNELLSVNQKIFIDRINEEIERANRYHHGIALTLFNIRGLSEYYKVSSSHALELVNRLSVGLRREVRKTDYFSWIEIDLFGVISLESYQRISDLETRISGFIRKTLEERGLFDNENFFPKSSCSLYPGKAGSAAALITDAKSKL